MLKHQKYYDGSPEDSVDVVGDCWRTALAFIMGLDRDEVPHFLEMERLAPETKCWAMTVEFVEHTMPGWTLYAHKITDRYESPYIHPDDAPRHLIVGGKSPRGSWGHAIVADSRTCKMVWDPHPSWDGIESEEPMEIYYLTAKGQ